jgi:hypothetical protein
MSAGNDQTLTDAVRVALGTVENTAKDSGAVRLALVYAEAIDADPTQLGKLGPGLLGVLESLGLTPAARARLVGKGVANGTSTRTRLDELRERRRARVDGA